MNRVTFHNARRLISRRSVRALLQAQARSSPHGFSRDRALGFGKETHKCVLGCVCLETHTSDNILGYKQWD